MTGLRRLRALSLTIPDDEEFRGIFGDVLYIDNLGGIVTHRSVPSSMNFYLGDEPFLLDEIVVGPGRVRLGLRPIEPAGELPPELAEQLAKMLAIMGRENRAPKPRPPERAACIHCLADVAQVDDGAAIRAHMMECDASPIVQEVRKLRAQLSAWVGIGVELWAACDEPAEDGYPRCRWTGKMSELRNGGGGVLYCPNCGSSAILENIAAPEGP